LDAWLVCDWRNGQPKNGGTLEKAAQMTNHASTRPMQLYDRGTQEVAEGGDLIS